MVVKEDYDINYKEPKYGQTLLMLTIQNDQYKMFEKFLELGANIQIRDTYDGKSAIQIAAGFYTHPLETRYLKALLSHGANPNDVELVQRKERIGRGTVLNAACEQSLDKVELLVEAGANVNYRDDITPTPLASALLVGKCDIALYLIEAGADFQIPIFSKERNEVRIVEMLRRLMFRLDSKQYADKMKLVRLLKQKGVDYRSSSIDKTAVERAKSMYPGSWQDYLNKY